MAEFILDHIDFNLYLRETELQTKVRPASSFLEAAKHRLRLRAAEPRSLLPWPKTHGLFEFRVGEVTLWAGQNGHGKTDLTTQLALSLLGQGERVCIASFEMKPLQTLARMLRMFHAREWAAHASGTGTNHWPDVATQDRQYDELVQWCAGRLWLYDQTGTAQASTVIGMARYCAKELGVTHVFVDSLMKCVRAEDDYNGQKDFVNELCALAQDCGVHIHLVHHLKKPMREADLPDKHDTKGSGAITDQVDNLFLVWRNKPKEDERKARGAQGSRAHEPDAYLLCRKQRNYDGTGEGEPTLRLWRHRPSGQLLGERDANPLFFANFPHQESV